MKKNLDIWLANRGDSQQPLYERCHPFVCVHFSIVILVTNLPENHCMCSCELQRSSEQRMGTNISPINMIVMGHIWIKFHNLNPYTPACKHVLVVGYVRTHVCVGLCLSQSLHAVWCSPTRPHRYGSGWSGCAAASFVCTLCMGQWYIQIFLHRDQCSKQAH